MAKPKFIRCEKSKTGRTSLININHVVSFNFEFDTSKGVYFLSALLTDGSEPDIKGYDSEDKFEADIRHIRLGTFNLI